MKKNKIRLIKIVILILFFSSVKAQNKPELQLPIAHTGHIHSITWSPDSTRILTTGADMKAKIWDANNGNLLITFEGHNAVVTSGFWAPDSKTIITKDYRKTAIIWNSETGTKCDGFKNTETVFNYAFFSPDGKYISSSVDKRIWEVKTGKVTQKFKNEIIYNSWSPDSRRVITSSYDGAIVKDIKTGETLSVLKEGYCSATSIKWSPKGDKIMTAHYKVRIFNSKSGLLLHTMTGHTNYIDETEWSKDGTKVLSVNRTVMKIHDEKDTAAVKVWNAETGKLLVSTESNLNPIQAYFSTNSKMIMVLSVNVDQHIIDIESKKELYTYPFTNKLDFDNIQFRHSFHNLLGSLSLKSISSPDGRKVAMYKSKLGMNTFVPEIYDMETKELLFTLHGHTNGNTHVYFSPNSELIATSSMSGNTNIWDAKTAKLIKVLKGHTNIVMDIDWSPDGNRIITSSWDSTIVEFDIKTGEELNRINLEKKPNTIKYSPDGKTIVLTLGDYIDLDNSIEIRNIETGYVMQRKIKPEALKIMIARFSHDGNFVVFGTIRGHIQIWNLSENKLLKEFKNNSKTVYDVCFSPDDEKIGSASFDYTAKIWNTKSQRKLHTLKGHNNNVMCVKWSPDGNKLYTFGQDYKVIEWKNKTGSLIRAIDMNQFWASDIDFKNRKILSYSANSLIKLTDLETELDIVKFLVIDTNDYFINTPNNYYMSTKGALKWMRFKINSKFYTFDQFDIKYNRPDIVQKRLGYASSELINAYHKSYLKRLKKMGFKEEELEDNFHIPDSRIKNFEYLPTTTDSSNIGLNLHFEDSKYKLDRINIWINNVAIYGINGINLRKEDTNSIERNIKLELTQGKNKIQISCLNQKGAESYKETLEITYKPKQETKPNLYLITIGTSKYQDSRFNLEYAAKDAQDVANLFAQDKYFGKVIIKTLTNEEVTKESIAELKTFLDLATRNDQVIIFVAGHGVLDANLDYYLASNDMDFNYPEKRGIAYEELEGVLDGIEPLKKILFVDACHSGEIDKEEMELAQVANTTVGEITFRSAGAGVINKTNNLGLKNTSELTKELFTDLRRGTGATVVSSAGGGEYAMESGEWKNGLFTYSLINGIQTKNADLNKDGKIMLSELQRYVQTEVVKLSNGKQQPTSRIENITMDFRVW